MKYNLLSILIMLLFTQYGLFGFENDSINIKDKKICKSINQNHALSFGNDYSIYSGIEYENNKWGKAILKGELGITKDNIFIDLGVGYGYPVLYSGNNTIFINGYLSWIAILGIKTQWDGLSEVIEVEYRKTWNKISLKIAPFYRRNDLNFEPGEIDKNDYIKNSLGIRIGIVYRLSNFKKR